MEEPLTGGPWFGEARELSNVPYSDAFAEIVGEIGKTFIGGKAVACEQYARDQQPPGLPLMVGDRAKLSIDDGPFEWYELEAIDGDVATWQRIGPTNDPTARRDTSDTSG